MSLPIWLTLALAACALIAGCAKQPGPPPPPPSKPQSPPQQIDGVYRGTSTRFQADSRACPSPGLVVLRVLDGTFQYRYGRTEIDSTIAPDGAVQGAMGAISLTGRLDGGRIEGDVSGESCGYHFRAVKRAH